MEETGLKGASIQEHLEIKEIKEDTIVLKDSGLRAILKVSAVNFSLKSNQEQRAIIQAYQEFLNSLDFSVQILDISRKMNISPYIQAIRAKEAEQDNELLKIQANHYAEFIKGLTEIANIMTESFYLVVTFSPPIAKQGFFTKLFGRSKPESVQIQQFQEMKNQLWQRVEFASSGLRGIGLRADPLTNQELIQLFYKLYNPEAGEEIRIE